MQIRNLIFIIIGILVIALLVLLGFSIYRPNPSPQTGEEGTNFFAKFLPFTKKQTTRENTETSVDVSGYVPPSEEKMEEKLHKISTFPVAGYGVFMKERYKETPKPTTPPPTNETLSAPTTKLSELNPLASITEKAPFIRYVARTTGNIYQTFADKIDGKKISNTLIPKVHDAYFGNGGDTVIMRYLKEGENTIETYLANLPKEYLGADGGEQNMSGYFLPENIQDISVSLDGKNVFYLWINGDRSAGIVLSLEDGVKLQLFESPFTEWLSSWSGDTSIVLTTKPSGEVPGYMYEISTNKKVFNKLLSEINGLTGIISPDGTKILYSDNSLYLNIFDRNTNTIQSVSLKTLPEKCVWNGTRKIYCAVPKFIEAGLYPDSWYQGEISFSDEIWSIDTNTGNTKIVHNGTNTDLEEIDAIKLSTEETGRYLFFLNKKDSYLWQLKLK